MNKLVALVALGLIIGGFLLVTFSYAAPTPSTETPSLPDISDITENRPTPPNDSPSIPDSHGTDTTPPSDWTPGADQTPDNTPPWTPGKDQTPDNTTTPAPTGESYQTKYFATGQTLNGGSQTNPGIMTVTMNYPVNHHHKEIAMIRLNSGTNIRWDLYKNGAIKADAPDPAVGVTRTIFLEESSMISSNTYVLKVYGSGVVQVTFLCEEWPKSQMSIFGTQTNDMTIGVVMLIAGFAALLLFGRH